jgi:hypothetical protein
MGAEPHSPPPTVCRCLHLDIWTLSVVPLLTFHTGHLAIYKSRRTQRPNYTSKISDPPALIGPGLTVRCAHQGVRTQFSSPSLFSRPQLKSSQSPSQDELLLPSTCVGLPLKSLLTTFSLEVLFAALCDQIPRVLAVKVFPQCQRYLLYRMRC